MTTAQELIAEKQRLASIGAGWHALEDMRPAAPEPPKVAKTAARKPSKAKRATAEPVSEQRRALYEKRAGRRELGTLQR